MAGCRCCRRSASLSTSKEQPLRLNERDAGGSGRRKLCVTDWNGDGLPDLLLNSKERRDPAANIRRKRGTRPTPQQVATMRFGPGGPIAKQDIEGHDVSPTVVDFNGDGVPDFVGGAEDGHLYYRRHPAQVGKKR